MMMLIAGILSPLANAQPEADESNVAPTFLEVYTVPRYPIGGEFNSASGTNGDIITVYAVIENGNAALLKTGFCNHITCSMGDSWADMTNVEGNLWSFQLPGDAIFGWPVYETSPSEGSYVYFQIYAEDADWVASYYPDFDGDNDDYVVPDDVIHIYPAFPPTQINSTSVLSKSTMFTEESFTVSGKANYWNSTSHPNDFSKLLPADECPVAVKVGSNTFNTKTNIWGNYSVQVTAPAAPGTYTVNVTVSNATANRNVPCKAPEQQITVNAHTLALTLALNKTVSTPGEERWANGTVSLDGAPAEAGLQVNLSVNGTATTWTATTVAGGGYNSQFTVPDTGVYKVSATVWHPTHKVKAWKEATLTVTDTPVADLEVAADDIIRTGTLMEGLNQRFNITVHNKGNADAVDARINITMDGALLNSTLRTIPDGTNLTIIVNWTATPGNHNLTVNADPQNIIIESNDANNNASLEFTIAARTIGITLDLSAADVEPSTPLWANGTVTIDGAVAPAGTEVNVSIEGTGQYWLVDTDAYGNYSAPFTASAAEGTYAINATAQYPGFERFAWAEETLTVAIPPTPDLAIFNSNITIIGNLVNGTALNFNVAVRNIGTAAATGAQVNISIDGVLLSSQRQNFAAGQERVLNVSWTAKVGNHNATVDVDKEGKIAEFSESNNHAWKTFTVATSEPEDIDVVIGPVLDSDGKPVTGATVTLTFAGTRSRSGTYTGLTNTAGLATISVPATYLGQSVTVNITKAGYDPVGYTGTLARDSVAGTIPAMNLSDIADDGPGTNYLMIAVIAVIAVAVALMLVGMKMKQKPAAADDLKVPEEEMPSAEAIPEEAQPEAPEDPRIAKLKNAYEEGRITKELYEKNLAKFQDDSGAKP